LILDRHYNTATNDDDDNYNNHSDTIIINVYTYYDATNALVSTNRWDMY